MLTKMDHTLLANTVQESTCECFWGWSWCLPADACAAETRPAFGRPPILLDCCTTSDVPLLNYTPAFIGRSNVGLPRRNNLCVGTGNCYAELRSPALARTAVLGPTPGLPLHLSHWFMLHPHIIHMALSWDLRTCVLDIRASDPPSRLHDVHSRYKSSQFGWQNLRVKVDQASARLQELSKACIEDWRNKHFLGQDLTTGSPTTCFESSTQPGWGLNKIDTPSDKIKLSLSIAATVDTVRLGNQVNIKMCVNVYASLSVHLQQALYVSTS